jgi:hypothetical protein
LTIGGKTGTAQKAKPGGGGYDQDNYIATFIGFFPAEDPQMVGLITLDSPKKEHLGGLTAAPVFKSAAQRIVSLTKESILTSTAKNILTTNTTSGSIQEELNQLSQADSSDLFLEPDTLPPYEVIIPDVRGLTAREAVRLFNSRDLQFTLRGSGMVINQIPQPNARVSKDQECILECQPQ